MMQAPSAPRSALGRHRILSPTAGVRVSPLCLGAMNFGEAHKGFLGECSKETAFAMLDFFYDNGGNFIDTAVNYQDNESEEWLGEWMQKTGRRDEMVIATKFTGHQNAKEKGKITSNFAGNSAKNIHTSVERSLRQLKTDYLDIYYLHVWDQTSSIPEIMHTLNDLVTARKVIYLGISDTPAWIVAKMNCYARQHGLRQFSLYQGQWNASQRDFEREIIPMCVDEGMALAPWGALGGGYFKTKEQMEQKTDGRSLSFVNNGREEQISLALDKIAKRKNTLITSVALAYVLHKAPNVFPIVGGRKIEHLKSNIEALSLKLSEEDIKEIEDAYPFEIGFPHRFLTQKNGWIEGPEDIIFNNRAGFFDYVVGPKAIPPHEGPLDASFKNVHRPPF